MILNNLGEVCVTYKYHTKLVDRPKISNCKDAFNVVKEFITDEVVGLQEQFIVLYLNNAGKLIGTYPAFKGAMTATTVDFKIIAVTGVKLMATKVIIAHNHPSGSMQPSTQDLMLTKRLKEALKLLEMDLIDHLILGPDNTYMSFSEEKLLN
jgi:DNA repair protein RadC